MLTTFNGKSSKYQTKRNMRKQLMADLERQTAQSLDIIEEGTTTSRKNESSLVSLESARQLVHNEEIFLDEFDDFSTSSKVTTSSLSTFRFGGNEGDYGFVSDGSRKDPLQEINLKIPHISVVEEPATSPVAQRNRCYECLPCPTPSNMTRTLIIATILAALALAIGLAAGFSSHDNYEGPGSLEYPFSGPNALLESTLAAFLMTSGVLDEDDLQANFSAQSKAVTIVATTDLVKNSNLEDAKPRDWITEEPLRQLVELYILNIFFIELEGETWLSKNNWVISEDPCSFEGVTCQQITIPVESGEVEILQKSGPSYKPIGQTVSVVRSIKLPSNGVKGHLPVELGLMSLTELDLRNNEIGGPLPYMFPQSLEMINLSHNMFSGEIPQTLGQCHSLNKIQLENNMLTGQIPSSLAHLDNLKVLKTHGNQMEGVVTSQFCLDMLRLLTLTADCKNREVECDCCTECH